MLPAPRFIKVEMIEEKFYVIQLRNIKILPEVAKE
jgi:hypothetical protein